MVAAGDAVAVGDGLAVCDGLSLASAFGAFLDSTARTEAFVGWLDGRDGHRLPRRRPDSCLGGATGIDSGSVSSGLMSSVAVDVWAVTGRDGRMLTMGSAASRAEVFDEGLAVGAGALVVLEELPQKSKVIRLISANALATIATFPLVTAPVVTFSTPFGK